MKEFRETLSILERDDDCRVVLLTSTGSSFCEGLELSMLLHTNEEERRLRAQEMADAVKYVFVIIIHLIPNCNYLIDRVKQLSFSV